MTKSRRWLTSAISETKKSDVQMPWARGPQRAQWKANAAARATGQTADRKLSA